MRVEIKSAKYRPPRTLCHVSRHGAHLLGFIRISVGDPLLTKQLCTELSLLPSLAAQLKCARMVRVTTSCCALVSSTGAINSPGSLRVGSIPVHTDNQGVTSPACLLHWQVEMAAKSARVTGGRKHGVNRFAALSVR